jgi:hypothetical protein
MRNPLSIEAFTDWCEKKPAGEEYEFTDCRNCAFAQYLKSLGFERPIVWPDGWQRDAFDKPRRLPHPKLNAMLNNGLQGRTFGALAKRLRAAMAEG